MHRDRGGEEGKRDRWRLLSVIESEREKGENQGERNRGEKWDLLLGL